MKHELVMEFPAYGCSCGKLFDYRNGFDKHLQLALPWWNGERVVTLIATKEEVLLRTDQPNPYGNEWSAIDANTYDVDFIGGEDDEWKESGGHGHGATEQEAIDDLFDQILEEIAA